MKIQKKYLGLRIFLLLFIAQIQISCQAAVVVMGTRQIYPEGARDIVVSLTNEGILPGLIQVWLDTGNSNEAPESISVPFLASPPVFRMEARAKRGVRLILTDPDLRKDRESVYWLNVLEIPPKPINAEDGNYLQFAVKTRIKVFYRPKILSYTSAIQAAKSIEWSFRRYPTGIKIVANNPSPHYISINGVGLSAAGSTQYVTAPAMIEPFSAKEYDLNVQDADASFSELVYSTIDDNGGTSEFKRPVSVIDSKL
jgi:chaperone protein EcpD